MPNAKTIWLDREQLARAGAAEKLFAHFDALLRAKGWLAMGGQIVDASIVAAPSPAASATTWALLTTGTASKSKVSRVFPGGSRASARWRSRAAGALGNLMLGQGGQKTRRRPAFLVGLDGKRGPDLLDGG